MFSSKPTNFLDNLDVLVQPVVTDVDNGVLCAMPMEEKIEQLFS